MINPLKLLLDRNCCQKYLRANNLHSTHGAHQTAQRLMNQKNLSKVMIQSIEVLKELFKMIHNSCQFINVIKNSEKLRLEMAYKT
jgi:hypothetical protein